MTRMNGRFLVKMTTAIMFLLVPFLLDGCYDRQELEQQAFVTTLGLDRAADGLIDCTLRIALPVNPSSGASKGGKGPLAGTGPVTYRAHGVTEAMLLANSSIERTITFSHLTSIIVGKDLAKEGLIKYIQPLIRYREFRRTVLLGVSTTTAKDIMQKDEPMLEQSAVRIADSISLVGNKTGLIPVVRVHDFASSIENPHQDIALPMYGLNPNVKSDEKGESDSQTGLVSYDTGKVERNGGNPMEFIGAAVFRGDKMVDTLSGKECIYLRLLQGRLRDANLQLNDPKARGEQVGVAVHKERAPEVRVKLSKPIQLSVRVPVDLDVTDVPSGVDYAEPVLREQLESSFEEQFNQELTHLLTKLLNEDQADVIPFSRYIRRDFLTHDKFARYPWATDLKTAKIKVDSSIHIRRFGVQLDPLRMAKDKQRGH